MWTKRPTPDTLLHFVRAKLSLVLLIRRQRWPATSSFTAQRFSFGRTKISTNWLASTIALSSYARVRCTISIRKARCFTVFRLRTCANKRRLHARKRIVRLLQMSRLASSAATCAASRPQRRRARIRATSAFSRPTAPTVRFAGGNRRSRCAACKRQYCRAHDVDELSSSTSTISVVDCFCA